MDPKRLAELAAFEKLLRTLSQADEERARELLRGASDAELERLAALGATLPAATSLSSSAPVRVLIAEALNTAGEALTTGQITDAVLTRRPDARNVPKEIWRMVEKGMLRLIGSRDAGRFELRDREAAMSVRLGRRARYKR